MLIRFLFPFGVQLTVMAETPEMQVQLVSSHGETIPDVIMKLLQVVNLVRLEFLRWR